MEFICDVDGQKSSEKIFTLKVKVSAKELADPDLRNQFYDSIFEFVHQSLMAEIPDLGTMERINNE